MAPAAPGQPTSDQEASCYNCGMKGHWMFACPEPARAAPAGLPQWHKKHQTPGPDRGSSFREGKGAVITRYPPPPHHGGPPAPYGPSFGQGPAPSPYPLAVSPAPLQGYPQPYPPPLPGYGSAFSPSGPPPPPPYSQYPPAPPPGPPPPAPPPPGPYGQPQPPYSQPPYALYPPQNYYPGGPPPPAPGPYPPPGAYPPQPFPPPGQYPPQPDYHFPQAPPPQYNPPPPPPTTGPFAPSNNWSPPPASHGSSLSLVPGLPPRPSDNRNNRDRRDRWERRDRHIEDRGKQQNRVESRRPPPNGQKESRRPSHRGSPSTPAPNRNDQPHKHPRPEHSPPREDWPAKGPSSAVSAPTKKDASKETVEIAEEFAFSQRDLAIVFPEPGKTKEADPVGIPLPAEYNDIPTIPPAYNSKGIKSDFFSEHNGKEFSSSVRESDDWSRLQYDPVFKLYHGMVLRSFSGSSHAYATYEPASRPSPTATIKMPPRMKIDRELFEKLREKTGPRGEESPKAGEKEDRQASSSKKRHIDEAGPRDDREAKRARPSSPGLSSPEGEQSRRNSLPPRTRSSPRPNVSRDPWDPLGGESSDYDRHGSTRDARNRRSSSADERPNVPAPRHDSGYHSGQSQDRYRSYRDEDRDTRRETETGWGQDESHLASERNTKRHVSDDSRSHHRVDAGRYQRRHSRSPSRSMSPRPRRRRSGSWDSNESYDSYDKGARTEGLSLLDCELLGLAGPDEPASPVNEKRRKKSQREIEEQRKEEEDRRRRAEEREKREERKRINPAPKKRKPAREVTAAFSRRW